MEHKKYRHTPPNLLERMQMDMGQPRKPKRDVLEAANKSIRGTLNGRTQAKKEKFIKSQGQSTRAFLGGRAYSGSEEKRRRRIFPL